MPSRFACLAVALVLLVACTGDDRPVVELEPVSAGQVVATVSAPARVDAAARQDVAASVSGVVAALEVASGARAEAGQVVVRLDSAQVALAEQQARAARAASDGGNIRVSAGTDATLDQTEAAVAQLDATVRPQLAAARGQAAAVEDPPQRAAAMAAVDAAEASYLATRTAIITAGQTAAAQQQAIAAAISSALEQAVAQATAPQRAQADFALATAQAQADELVLRAPFAGTVEYGDAAATDGAALPSGLPDQLAGAVAGLAGAEGGGTLRTGAPVVAGQTLFTVYDLSQVYVNADVDEVDAPQVAVGQDAVVLVDAFPDVEFPGVVESVAVEAQRTEAGGVGYPARIRLLGAPAGVDVDLSGLRVGMTASAEITTEVVDADLVVPSRALLRREGGTIVFVLRDGRVDAVQVEVTVVGADDAAVSGELAVGDRVVVSGYEDLEDEAQVRTG